jgi:hypothetical protein
MKKPHSLDVSYGLEYRLAQSIDKGTKYAPENLAAAGIETATERKQIEDPEDVKRWFEDSGADERRRSGGGIVLEC